MDFFDANAFIGRPMRAIPGAVASWEELLGEMDAAGVGEALVWHIAQQQYHPAEGNRLLCEAAGDSSRLWKCWTVLPPQTGEVPPDTLFEEMKSRRVVALRIFPNENRYIANRQVFGALMDEISDRRIPLLLSIEPGIGWPPVYALLKDYPKLTCILCDIGIWGQDRNTWPLLEGYPNVHIETSMLSIEASGIEAAVRRFGSERLVFGSGFPLRYLEAPMLDLVRSEIPDEDKRKIASGNLKRLIAEVEL